MPLFTAILMAMIGIAFTVIGFQLWRKQRVSLIHSYHYTHVKEADLPAYTAQMGKACLVMGAGCFLYALLALFGEIACGFLAFGLFFLAGLGMMLLAQRRYNRR